MLTPKHFGYPFKLSPREKGRRLSVDDKMAILWALSHEWSLEKIASNINAAYRTVWKFRRGLFHDPSQIVHLPVISVDAKKQVRCRLCGEVRKGKTTAYRHVLSHFLPYEVAKVCFIDPQDTKLL